MELKKVGIVEKILVEKLCGKVLAEKLAEALWNTISQVSMILINEIISDEHERCLQSLTFANFDYHLSESPLKFANHFPRFFKKIFEIFKKTHRTQNFNKFLSKFAQHFLYTFSNCFQSFLKIF